ncbi:hypothetical protein M378DRAFT_163697 [Amanita muscaria Koide BX008]|uniref:Uncharacterized protein n=1 Tax=Amanita muscaria (strain Koide BX008) TaxID=946122 RepID=A0A0C2WQP9_AMAMK|nr:hypothetical protein M378DRAFT_163697 [Amanita muscaria Koide BX008]
MTLNHHPPHNNDRQLIVLRSRAKDRHAGWSSQIQSVVRNHPRLRAFRQLLTPDHV